MPCRAAILWPSHITWYITFCSLSQSQLYIFNQFVLLLLLLGFLWLSPYPVMRNGVFHGEYIQGILIGKCGVIYAGLAFVSHRAPALQGVNSRCCLRRAWNLVSFPSPPYPVCLFIFYAEFGCLLVEQVFTLSFPIVLYTICLTHLYYYQASDPSDLMLVGIINTPQPAMGSLVSPMIVMKSRSVEHSTTLGLHWLKTMDVSCTPGG